MNRFGAIWAEETRRAPSTRARSATIAVMTLVLLLPWQAAKAALEPLFEHNLIENGDAELGEPSETGFQVVAIPGWVTLEGNFTVVPYEASGFPDFESPGPEERGIGFFAGGPSNGFSSAWQIIDVSAGASEIDDRGVGFNLSGYLGGFYNQNDNAILSAVFQDAEGEILGSAAIGPVSAADRVNVSGLLFRSAEGLVPMNTRRIEVQLDMTRVAGAYNDSYSDNLSLVLSPIPLPPTILLFASGMVAVLRYRPRPRRTCPASPDKANPNL